MGGEGCPSQTKTTVTGYLLHKTSDPKKIRGFCLTFKNRSETLYIIFNIIQKVQEDILIHLRVDEEQIMMDHTRKLEVSGKN